MNTEIAVLFAATFSVAFFHTISPDHWLPFVMVGRSQKWPILKTELVALAAGIGHVGTSVLIALVGIFIGAELSERFASIAEVATGSALIAFGFGYALYMWRKGGHAHFTIGSKRLAGGHVHSHDDDHEHQVHDHSHDDDPFPSPDHSGSHGDHGHGHSHARLIDLAEEPKAPYTLVIIMGLTPCVALLPLAFAAASHGAAITTGVIVLFAVATIVPILILTFLGSKGLSFVRLRWFDKYGDIVTGIVIGCIGLMTMFLGL